MSSSIETEDSKDKSETRLNNCVRAFQCSKQESFHVSLQMQLQMTYQSALLISFQDLITTPIF